MEHQLNCWMIKLRFFLNEKKKVGKKAIRSNHEVYLGFILSWWYWLAHKSLCVTVVSSHQSPKHHNIESGRATMTQWPQGDVVIFLKCTLITSFMRPTWGPAGADRTQLVPMYLAIRVIFKHILQIKFNSTSCENTLWRMPQNTLVDESTLVQAMAWCCQASSQCRIQCWTRSHYHKASLGHNDLKLQYTPHSTSPRVNSMVFSV